MKNKRIIVIGAFFIVALGYFFFGRDVEIQNFPPTGRIIVAFGDSLVAGQGATTGGDFVSLISRKIGIPIVNLGKSGDTTESALARLDSALVLRPDVAIVLLGGNDALRKVPIDETRRNLSFIIDRFQNTGAVVILLGVRGGLLGDPYDGMYKKLARETGSVYVSDVLQGLFGDPRYMSDTIHPNDAGYSLIADRIAPVLAGLFK